MDGRGGGGGAEDDGGEPPERSKSRSENQKRIGRPRNKPPPPPREVPVEIIPRPQESVQHRKRRRSLTPVAGPSTQNTKPKTIEFKASPTTDTSHNHRKKPGRARPPRKLTDNLKEGEYLIQVKLLHPNGTWVLVPNCLVTPYWNHSYILPETVEGFGYEAHILNDAQSRTSVTPRGENRDNRRVGLWMEIEEMNIPEHLIVLPTFNKTGLGVSLILGKLYIESVYGPDNWPPSNDTQYVAWDGAAADMPIYDMDQAPLYQGFWDDGGVGIDATMDPNVYLSGMGDNTINHDLTAVGAGIPAEYPEYAPDWDGYLQEN